MISRGFFLGGGVHNGDHLCDNNLKLIDSFECICLLNCWVHPNWIPGSFWSNENDVGVFVAKRVNPSISRNYIAHSLR